MCTNKKNICCIQSFTPLEIQFATCTAAQKIIWPENTIPLLLDLLWVFFRVSWCWSVWHMYKWIFFCRSHRSRANRTFAIFSLCCSFFCPYIKKAAVPSHWNTPTPHNLNSVTVEQQYSTSTASKMFFWLSTSSSSFFD